MKGHIIQKSFICIFAFVVPNASLIITRKLNKSAELKYTMKGDEIIKMIILVALGVLGMVPTVVAGCCSRRLKGNRK